MRWYGLYGLGVEYAWRRRQVAEKSHGKCEGGWVLG